MAGIGRIADISGKLGRAALVASAASAAVAWAAPISFEFTGIWLDAFFMGSPVQPGDSFVARLWFDPDLAFPSRVVQGSVSGTARDYELGPGAAGIELRVGTVGGTVVFATDPLAITLEVFDAFDGGAGPLDRFLLQGLGTAAFPAPYGRPIERLSIDLVDADLNLIGGFPLPSQLAIPTNGYAVVGVQGGAAVSELDFNGAGILQTVRSVPEPARAAMLALGLVALASGVRQRRTTLHGRPRTPPDHIPLNSPE